MLDLFQYSASGDDPYEYSRIESYTYPETNVNNILTTNRGVGETPTNIITEMTFSSSIVPVTTFTYSNGSTAISSNTTLTASSYTDNTFTGILIWTFVTSIGDNAFKDLSGLTSVNFQSGSQLATIGNYAFKSSGLDGSITLPASVTTISSYAFQLCSDLTSVTFESGSVLTTIGNYAFQISGLTSITLPTSVTSIGDRTFQLCTGLTSVNFSALILLEAIGNHTFRQSGLTGTITLPTSMKSIGIQAFYSCSNLTSVNFSTLILLETIGDNAFYGSGLDGSITLPASVTSIGDYAFQVCSDLTSVTFESGSVLTTIGKGAFESSELTGTITLPASLQSIGEEAFKECTSLTEVTFEKGSLTAVGSDISNNAFTGCTSLTIVNAYQTTISAMNWTTGSNQSFYGKDVTISEISVVYVGEGSTSAPYYTFYSDISGTNVLTNLLLDTAKVYSFFRVNTTTNAHPFYLGDQGRSSSSTAITISGDGNASSGITGTQSFTLTFNTFDPGTDTLTYYCTNHTSMTSTFVFLMPTIFSYSTGPISTTLDTSLTTSTNNATLTGIVIGTFVTDISNNAFKECSNLTSLSFDANSQLKTIGVYAFYLSNLSGSITLPASLTSIGTGVFFGLSNLTFVSFESDSQLATINAYAFKNSV